MTIDTREHADLSFDAYNNRPIGKEIIIHGIKYRVIDTDSKPSGYQATAYQRADTGEVVIAQRGTEKKLNDVATDAGMALIGINNQLDDAVAFTERALAKAKETQANFPNPITISFTGHSLGGTLAEIMAARYGYPAETFNAYGAADLTNLQQLYGIDPKARYPDIVNHMRATDVVSAGRHLGEVRTYATPEDIKNLERGGYREDPTWFSSLTSNPVRTADDFSAHSMSNFVPDKVAADAKSLSAQPVSGDSVMTADNEQRARAHEKQIGAFRDDVVRARLHLAAAVAPEPLVATINASGEKGRAMTEGAVKLGHAAVKEARALGENISRIYHSVTDDKPAPHAEPKPAPLLNDPGHRDYAMFKQAQAGMRQIDAQMGRESDARTDRAAAALVVSAREKGLERIDSVHIGPDGARVFAVQGASGTADMKIGFAATDQAVNTTIRQSTQALEQMNQQKPQTEVQARDPAQQPSRTSLQAGLA
jgi:hypothetical protein